MLRNIYIVFFLFAFATCFAETTDPPLNDTGETNRWIDSLLAIDQQDLDPESLLMLHNDFIAKYRHTNPKKAYDYALLAFDLHETTELSHQHARSFNLTGNVFFDQGFFSTATKYYKKCLDVAIELNDIGIIGHTYNDIGYTHRKTNNNEQAMVNFYKAIEVLQGHDFPDVVAHTYSNLCMAYLERQEYDSSIVVIQKAIWLFDSLNMERDKYRCLAYEASANSMMGNSDLAETIMDSVFTYYPFDTHDDSLLLSSLYRFTHAIYLTSGKLAQAIEFGNQGLLLSEKLDYHIEMTQTNLAMSETFLKMGDTLEAINRLMAGLAISQEYEYIDMTVFALESLLLIKQHLSKDELLEFYEQYHEVHHKYTEEVLNDKVKNFDDEIEMARLESENKLLEAESRAQSNLMFGIIAILILISVLVVIVLHFYKKRNRLNKQLAEINITLGETLNKQKELNNTKDKFFSIIAHDLKNPFGAFKSSLEMLSEQYDEFTDEERQAFLFELKKSSSNLKKLLEDLLTWSQSQRNTIAFNPVKAPLKDIVRFVFDSLQGQANRKEIELAEVGLKDTIVLADVGMLSTIIRNIVSNAIKYTRERGRISIYYDRIGQYDTITIKDTGIGMEPDKLATLFVVGKNKSTPGTNQESGTGLGLILTKEFIEKHDGEIKVESVVGKGTTFIISLPNSESNSNDDVL